MKTPLFAAGQVLPIIAPSAVLDVDQNAGRPTEFTLDQNYPNPFNPATTISYGVPGPGLLNVKLAVYDLLGREVAVLVDGEQLPGSYSVRFNARGLSSGTYVYRVRVGEHVASRKMILAR